MVMSSSWRLQAWGALFFRPEFDFFLLFFLDFVDAGRKKNSMTKKEKRLRKRETLSASFGGVAKITEPFYF